jgi:DNA-binding XRE family transcriptional regulator
MSDMNRAQELVALRKALGLSQSTMAQQLDIAQRDYQAFEWGESEIPDVYLLAFERIALKHAAIREDPLLLPPALRAEALRLARTLQAGA